MKKRRWTCIDILKCLAAIAVVEIHKPLEIQGGDEFLILCRFAVPVFFMITGFFYPETVAKKRELKQFGKIFTITIGANLLYLLWEILLAVEKRENIKEALLARFEERVPEDFILWNFSPLSPHLWYLQALLYVLVIAFIVEHLGLRKLAYLAIPVLLAGSLIKGSYSLFFVGKEDCHIYYARNFLYCGLPFFLAGLLVWIQKGGSSWLSGQEKKWDTFLLCGLPVFWNMAVMEQKWLGKAKCPGNSGRVRRNHFSGNLHLSSFYWLAEFLCGELAYQSIGKSGKRLFHAYLCSSLRGSAGLVQML